MLKIKALYIEPGDDHTAQQIGQLYGERDVANLLKLYECSDGEHRLLIEISAIILFTCMANFPKMRLSFKVFFQDWSSPGIHDLGFEAEITEPASGAQVLHQGLAPDSKTGLVPKAVRIVRVLESSRKPVVLNPGLRMPLPIRRQADPA